MQYLVDAYNLLFRAVKKRGSLQNTRQLIIEELNESVSHLNMAIVLVFDGADENLSDFSRGHFGAIELIYTSKGKSADEYIIEEVALAKSPEKITVVTSDRELANHCKNLGAQKMSIHEFISLLAKKKLKKKRVPSTSSRKFQESTSEFTRLLRAFEKKLQLGFGDEEF